MPSNPGFVPNTQLTAEQLNTGFETKADETEVVAVAATAAAANSVALVANNTATNALTATQVVQEQVAVTQTAVLTNTAAIAANTAATGALANRATAVETSAAASAAALLAANQVIANQGATITTLTATNEAQDAALAAAVNRITALEAGAPPAVPNPPTAPTSTAVTTTSVSLSATAPGSGPAVTSYKWEYKRTIDPTFLLSSVVTLTGTQSGLTSGTSYDFRVSAVNAAGPSTPSVVYTVSTTVALVESAHGTSVTTTVGSIVDVPLNIYTLATATGGATNFQIMINGVRNTLTTGVVLMKYYNPVGTATPGTPKHSVVHQNTVGNWYVSGTITANIGAWTQIAGDPDAPPLVVPNSPTAATSTAVTSTSVSLSATAPVGGSAVTSYKWEYKRTVDPAFIVSSVTTLTGTQSGLANATQYDFRVSAVNAAGPSVPSTPVYQVSTAPGALTESAHGTTVTTVGPTIVDAVANVYTLVTGTGGAASFQIAINGVPQTVTNSVNLMKYYNPSGPAKLGTTKHSVVQRTIPGGWYIVTGVTGNIATWVELTGDPDITATAPSPAASVGYNRRAFGPNVTIGGNWFQFSGNNVQNADGSVTCQGNGNGYNMHLVTATFPGGATVVGTSFANGAYFEATLKWTGTTQQTNGWPAWWTNDTEHQINGNVGPQWPGQPPGVFLSFELDFMEAFNESGFGTAMHNWNNASGSVETFQAFPNAFTWPAGVSHADYHRYGCLWVPSTPTSLGYYAAFFDGVEWGRISWDHTTTNIPAPPVWTNSGTRVSTGHLLDSHHMYLILGSGANNPMTVSEVSVWQA